MYWNVREDINEIETLFQAPTSSGYVAFGWGYSELVRSNVVIAFQSSAGHDLIEEYLISKSALNKVRSARNRSMTLIDADMQEKYSTGMFRRKLLIDGFPAIAHPYVDSICAVGVHRSLRESFEHHDVRGTTTFDVWDTYPNSSCRSISQQ